MLTLSVYIFPFLGNWEGYTTTRFAAAAGDDDDFCDDGDDDDDVFCDDDGDDEDGGLHLVRRCSNHIRMYSGKTYALYDYVKAVLCESSSEPHFPKRIYGI